MQHKFNPFSDPAPTGNTTGESFQPFDMKLYDHLQQGNTINFVQAQAMGIPHLDRRIAELKKSMTIHSRFIRIHNTRCQEYSLQPFV